MNGSVKPAKESVKPSKAEQLMENYPEGRKPDKAGGAQSSKNAAKKK